MKLTKRESKGLTVCRQPMQERQPRFQIVKLEERIAPHCHTNPHGKKVGGHRCFY